MTCTAEQKVFPPPPPPLSPSSSSSSLLATTTTPYQLEDQPMLHLFSPTTLTCDLAYVDKTYYESRTPIPLDQLNQQQQQQEQQQQQQQQQQQKSVTASQQSLHSMVFNHAVGLLVSMSRLDLRSLNLASLPNQISQLSHLTSLDLSHNHLSTLPTTIQQLKHLRHLNLSYNRFTSTPRALSQLAKLTTLDVSHNPSLHTISSCLSNAARLNTFDVSHTNIESLPAELAYLLVIRTDHCPRLMTNTSHHVTYSLRHDPPSLLELCTRQLMMMPSYRLALTHYQRRSNKDDDNDDTPPHQPIQHSWKSLIKHKLCRTTPPIPVTINDTIIRLKPSSLSLLSSTSTWAPINKVEKGAAALLVYLPNHLWNYMINALPCSFCGVPCVQGLVMRYRIVQRLDESLLPVHYRLCCAHWSNESDRLLSLFSSVTYLS